MTDAVTNEDVGRGVRHMLSTGAAAAMTAGDPWAGAPPWAVAINEGLIAINNNITTNRYE